MSLLAERFEGSGNVSRDLGLRNPEEPLAKAKLAARIVPIFEERKLSQAQAAKLLGIGQPKVSQIYRGRLDDFSIERIVRFQVRRISNGSVRPSHDEGERPLSNQSDFRTRCSPPAMSRDAVSTRQRLAMMPTSNQCVSVSAR